MKQAVSLSFLIFFLSAVLIWVLFFWEPAATVAPQPNQALALASQPVGGDFSLTGATGPVSLADFRGKVVVMYLGYTSCPDVCTTSLSLIAQGFSLLPPESLARVQGLFVSVDPERDTPERLADYAPFFHPRLLGISGSTGQIADVARKYGSSYRIHAKDADGQYAVDHSSITYIIAPDGKLFEMLPHGSSAESIAAAINKALAAT